MNYVVYVAMSGKEDKPMWKANTRTRKKALKIAAEALDHWDVVIVAHAVDGKSSSVAPR